MKDDGTSTIIDFYLIFQKLSKILLGITIMLAYYDYEFDSVMDESSALCMYLSISIAVGPVEI